MVLMRTGNVTVEVSESKAEKLASVLGYNYVLDQVDVVTDDLSPSDEEDEVLIVPPKRPGRPRRSVE
jgi:hypothetical protein